VSDERTKEPYQHSEEEVRLFYKRTRWQYKATVEEMVEAALAMGALSLALALVLAPASN
jgi:hypothetical protein